MKRLLELKGAKQLDRRQSWLDTVSLLTTTWLQKNLESRTRIKPLQFETRRLSQPFNLMSGQRLLNLLILGCCVFAVSCAVVRAPNGGPEDKTPPSIDSSASSVGHANFHDKSITLKFSEYVERSKVMESLILSPEKRMDFSWSGRECEISFPDGLDSNTTYALTLGTEYTDLHGNKPSQAYTTIFSTASRLDSGIVTGEIVDPSPTGVMVYLYVLDAMRADTLDIRHTKARYRTQVGTNGQFSFRALADGAYRIVALRTQNRDGLVHEESDAFGTGTDTLRISHSSSPHQRLKLSPARDLSAPQLIDARPRNAQRVELQCNEALDSSNVNASAIVAMDSLGHRLQAIAAYRTPSNSKNIIALFPLQSQLDGWTLHLSTDSSGARDLAGLHFGDSSSSCSLSLGKERDSLPPMLLSSPLRDSTTNVELSPRFLFSWNTAMQRIAADAHMGIFRNNQRVAAKTVWLNDNSLEIVPQDSLEADSWYELRFRLNAMRSYDNLPAPDSTLHLRFRTFDTRMRGTIKGMLTDSLQPKAQHILSLSIKNGPTRVLILNGTGSFRFDNLPEGEYFLEAYCDSNRDGRYSSGSVFPFAFAERISVPRASVAVKARWVVEDIKVDIP